MRPQKKHAVVPLLILLAGPLSAQEARNIEDIAAPSSPAFTLLGVEATAIERPTTAKALALGFLAAAGRNDDVIPRDYAVEVTPYWLSERAATLTYSDWLASSWAEAFAQSIALSIATSIDDESDSTTEGEGETESATGIGGALRFSLIQNRLPASRRVEHSQINEELDRALRDAQDRKLNDAEEGEIAAADERAHAAAKKLESFLMESRREGFALDGAFGVAGVVPKSGELDDGEFSRAGIWLTPSYGSGWIDLVGVARYMRDEEGEGEDLLDLGARALVEVRELELSIEYVGRVGISEGESGDTERIAGGLSYRLTDTIALSLTVGQDFKNDATNDGRFVFDLGLVLGFGNSELPLT